MDLKLAPVELNPLHLVMFAFVAVVMVGAPFLFGGLLRAQMRSVVGEENPWPGLPWADLFGFVGFWAAGLLVAMAVAAGFDADPLAEGIGYLLRGVVQVGLALAVLLIGSRSAASFPTDQARDRQLLLLAAVLLSLGTMASLSLFLLLLLGAVPAALLLASRSTQARLGEGLANLAAGFTLRSRGAGSSQIRLAGRWIAVGKIGLFATITTESQSSSTQPNREVLAWVLAAEGE
ncbi:MAG: hypothetical protein JXX28_07095 [Deltaproteobacteria bacterium]|nr:hypothetical protein [Deltaproteobacteria bacterium]